MMDRLPFRPFDRIEIFLPPIGLAFAVEGDRQIPAAVGGWLPIGNSALLPARITTRLRRCGTNPSAAADGREISGCCILSNIVQCRGRSEDRWRSRVKLVWSYGHASRNKPQLVN